jgi:hypothetical protein
LAPADCPREVNAISSNCAARRGVIVKQLVEVPHAIEQQYVRMLGFDPQILLHHRGGALMALQERFSGDREAVRRAAVATALRLIIAAS